MKNIFIAIRTAQAVLALFTVVIAFGTLWGAKELASVVINENVWSYAVALIVWLSGFAWMLLECAALVALHDSLEEALAHSAQSEFRRLSRMGRSE